MARYAEVPGFSDERAARAAVQEGRKLWSYLPAWPWAFYRDSAGRLPDSWQDAGPSDEVSRALQEWFPRY